MRTTLVVVTGAETDNIRARVYDTPEEARATANGMRWIASLRAEKIGLYVLPADERRMREELDPSTLASAIDAAAVIGVVKPRNIYVASSWRNPSQPSVVAYLREQGHNVYDFREPEPGNDGFRWSEIDPDWQQWNAETFRGALSHPVAQHGFALDMNALRWADTTILVMPCGRSAHLEAGYAAGAGQRVAILLSRDQPAEPELMYSMAGIVSDSIEEIASWLVSP
jgi:hypothetical protein